MLKVASEGEVPFVVIRVGLEPVAIVVYKVVSRVSLTHDSVLGERNVQPGVAEVCQGPQKGMSEPHSRERVGRRTDHVGGRELSR